MVSRVFLAVALVLTGASAAGAQTSMLDLVSADAGAAVVIRNLEELQAKGDKFIDDSKLQLPFRPSQLFAMGIQFLGIQGGVDAKAPAAIVLTGADKEARSWNDFFNRLVIVLSFADLDKMAAGFGFKAGELKPNMVARGNGMNFGKFFFARGKQLYFGHTEKAVAKAVEGKKLSEELAASHAKSLNESDLLLFLAPKAIGQEWEGFLGIVRGKIGKRDDPAEQEVVNQFLDTLAHVRFGFATARIDGGIGLRLLTLFSEDRKGPARKFLARLRGGPGYCDLRGLPEGNVLAAQATHGDGSQNGVLAKVLFDFLLNDLLETREVLAAVDRPVVVGVLTEIWNRLQGSRAGLYLTPAEDRLGLFSLLAILDTDDAGKFLADMKTLARIADGTGLDLTNKDSSKQRVDVPRLIKDLGDPKFRVRESATLKLRLLGEPALVHLEKASASADLEVSRRVGRLRAQIAEAAAQRRKELLSRDVLHHIHPTFAFVAGAEKRGGHAIDVVRIKLADKELPAAAGLRQLLGPEWNNLRLAVHGNKVVVLLGSEVELLDKALKNLDQKSPGLAASMGLDKFAISGKRNIEFHASMEKIAHLLGGAVRPAGTQVPSLTSFGLTVELDHVQLDVWLPTSEVRVIGKKGMGN